MWGRSVTTLADPLDSVQRCQAAPGGVDESVLAGELPEELVPVVRRVDNPIPDASVRVFDTADLSRRLEGPMRSDASGSDQDDESSTDRPNRMGHTTVSTQVLAALIAAAGGSITVDDEDLVDAANLLIFTSRPFGRLETTFTVRRAVAPLDEYARDGKPKWLTGVREAFGEVYDGQTRWQPRGAPEIGTSRPFRLDRPGAPSFKDVPEGRTVRDGIDVYMATPATYPRPEEFMTGVIDGIRPHRVMRPGEEAMVRQLAEGGDNPSTWGRAAVAELQLGVSGLCGRPGCSLVRAFPHVCGWDLW